jgi:hypothetical protein
MFRVRVGRTVELRLGHADGLVQDLREQLLGLAVLVAVAAAVGAVGVVGATATAQRARRAQRVLRARRHVHLHARKLAVLPGPKLVAAGSKALVTTHLLTQLPLSPAICTLTRLTHHCLLWCGAPEYYTPVIMCMHAAPSWPAQRRGRLHTPPRRIRPRAAPDLPARLPLGGLQARALGLPRGALLRRALAPAARPRPALVGLPPHHSRSL